jgi:hypothetical protein
MAINAFGDLANSITSYIIPKPLQHEYSFFDHPITAKVVSPQSLQNAFFLWAYRIIASPFILLTFLFDNSVGNLYRLTLSNHSIGKINQKITEQNKQKTIRLIIGGAIALVSFAALTYSLKSAPSYPNDPKNPLDPKVENSLLTSFPILLNLLVLSGSGYAAIQTKSPSVFIWGVAALALWNKNFHSSIGGFFGTSMEVCKNGSAIPAYLYPLRLVNNLTNKFEMHSNLGILFPLSIGLPALIGKIGEYWSAQAAPAAAPAAPAAAPAAPAAAPAPAEDTGKASWLTTAKKGSAALISIALLLGVDKLTAMIPFIRTSLFNLSGHALIITPFNRIADYMTNLAEGKSEKTRNWTYSLSAIYAIANATLIYNTIISCHTGPEIILGFGAACGAGYLINKGLRQIHLIDAPKKEKD